VPKAVRILGQRCRGSKAGAGDREKVDSGPPIDAPV